MDHLLGRFNLDRYFARGLSSGAEVRLRRHLDGCARCRERYRRHLVAESLLPDGADHAEERLWRSIRREVRPARLRRWAVPALLAAAMTVLLLAPFRPRPPVARGPESVEVGSPRVHLFRVEGPGRAEPLGARMAPTDALVFAYSNPGSTYDHLMVFAVDEQYQVHWYYPAFEGAGQDPAAIEIARRRAGVELSEQITHPYTPGKLRLYALFLDHAERVSRVEALVAESVAGPRVPLEREVRLPLSGAHQESRLLEVAR